MFALTRGRKAMREIPGEIADKNGGSMEQSWKIYWKNQFFVEFCRCFFPTWMNLMMTSPTSPRDVTGMMGIG